METGESFLIAGSAAEREDLSAQYLLGGGSRLDAGLDRLTASDRTLAAGAIVRTGSLMDFVGVLSNTFWGHQNRHEPEWREQLREETDEALERLAALGLLERLGGRQYTLTPAGASCALYGICVESAERVLITVDEMTAASEKVGPDELLALAQLMVELELYIPEVEESAEVWRNRLGAWGRGRPVLVSALERPWGEVPSAEVALKRLKRCAVLRSWLEGRPVDEVEAAFSTVPEEPGLGHVREIARRTGDLLPGVAGLVASRQPDRKARLEEQVLILRPALEYGVTQAAAGLQRLRLGLTRKQTLTLARQGIMTLEALEQALESEREKLEQLLTTPVVHDIAASLMNRSLRRRRQVPPASDEILSLFPDGPLS